MRLLCLAAAFLLSVPLAAQDKDLQGKKPAVKPAAKKKPAGGAQKAHRKPTPEQVRKFNELEKKQ
jgi:hypothetical protein